MFDKYLKLYKRLYLYRIIHLLYIFVWLILTDIDTVYDYIALTFNIIVLLLYAWLIRREVRNFRQVQIMRDQVEALTVLDDFIQYITTMSEPRSRNPRQIYVSRDMYNLLQEMNSNIARLMDNEVTMVIDPYRRDYSYGLSRYEQNIETIDDLIDD